MTTIKSRSEIPTTTQVIDNLFSLNVRQQARTTHIVMRMVTPIINTIDLPLTSIYLEKILPTVLTSTCFNEQQLPFAVEVKQTEIGHLFEHILLEYLCQLKLENGFNEAMYRGHTDWNWFRDPQGTFHITISSGINDLDIFPLALNKSIKLVRTIMEANTMELFLLQNTPFSHQTYKKVA